MKKFLKVVCKYLMIILGTALYATGTVFFVDPHDLAPGGATGVAIIIKILFGRVGIENVSVGLLVLLINIPLLIIGFIKMGKEFLFGTLFGTIGISVMIYLLEMLRANATQLSVIIPSDPLISGVAGGLLMALGLAVVFKRGATTGGTDIVVKLLRLKYRHMKMGRVLLVADAIIAVSSVFVVGIDRIETVLYSLVSMFVCSMMLDFILYGPDGAKLIYIVSDKSGQIAERIMTEISVGVTMLEGEGAYTKTKKEVLMCVVKKHLFPKVKDIVMQEDSRAFLIVTSASEVFGEGYKVHTSED